MRFESESRRTFVRFAGAATLLSVAGCAGAPTDGSDSTASPTEDGEDGHAEERPEGVSAEAFVHGPVPDAYRTASSQAGEERDPENLQTQADVQFQEAAEAVEAGLAQEGNRCGNCAEFIPDQNGDGFGACAKVEGYIAADDWCVIWESIEEAQSGS